ncbi:MAG TPA: hypothetical protein VFA15_07325, partial [Nitrososphaera sp.]|nr:hypothetical protein [Nitrososphaera sp.]
PDERRNYIQWRRSQRRRDRRERAKVLQRHHEQAVAESPAVVVMPVLVFDPAHDAERDRLRAELRRLEIQLPFELRIRQRDAIQERIEALEIMLGLESSRAA